MRCFRKLLEINEFGEFNDASEKWLRFLVKFIEMGDMGEWNDHLETWLRFFLVISSKSCINEINLGPKMLKVS